LIRALGDGGPAIVVGQDWGALAEPGALASTLGYYRAMFDPARADPRLDDVRARLVDRITVPTLALCGGDDLRADLMREQSEHFQGPYRSEEVPGAAHFLHREKPEDVNGRLLEWLEAS
jgi:pimeloyl-ACP methyl ester carboxylesterase